MTSYTLDTTRMALSDEQFFQLCIDNRDYRFERNNNGEVIFMPPTGAETGDRNSEINFQLRLWNNQYKLGKVFDSSTGFRFPSGAMRSPDASWIPLTKWETLEPSSRSKFLPFAPDFMIELLSPSDRAETTRQKMQEYIENGTELGWLINRKQKEVEIYSPTQELKVLISPTVLTAEDILPNFKLNLASIW